MLVYLVCARTEWFGLDPAMEDGNWENFDAVSGVSPAVSFVAFKEKTWVQRHWMI